MASLEFAGDSGSLSDINASQGEFRSQIAALTDMMKQIVGNAAVFPGTDGQADPLNAPFTLYVNPYTGSDEFVGGAYNEYEAGATDEEIIASKLKRLEKQRLTCGYTPQRPFKTINRAVIEAAIITSKDWYTYTDPRAHVDCVSIVLSTGVHTLYNDPGQASTSITSWGLSKDPTTEELIKFNPATVGGVLLPRGCSLCGPDLRKTTIRPNWVPATSDEAADYSNRRGMLKITGTGYFFGFTAMDKVGLAESHHLLDLFHFASKTELDDFYAKVLSAVGSGADLAAALTVTRGTEYQIVGPIDRTQTPSAAWDTTASASPYIFNCSVRSDYGMGGAFMDGSKVQGLKSMVCANFTGVSLQKDMSCWQRYSEGNWTSTTYEQYISTDPDSIRMNPARMSRHISAINDAFIQEVSVFAIGHGVHHFTDLGGEITVTNSNSSFGGCAALSRGYKNFAFTQDQNWTVAKLRVPLNLGEKTGNVRRIFLGTVASISGSGITLDLPLAVDASSDSVPAILLADGYTLRSGTKIWIENPTGDHWRTDLSASAWASSSPSAINISSAFTQAGTNDPVGTNPDTGNSFAIGKRVYIRRLVDTRTPAERRVSLVLNNTASARLPERNFALQTDPDRTGGAISSALGTTGESVLLISSSGSYPISSAGVAKSAEITLRRGAATNTYANNTYYRAGTIVTHSGKHYQALRNVETTSLAPNPAIWGETFVHMPSAYNAEDQINNEAPFITIDTDTDAEANTQTCGINFSTAFSTAGTIQDQYRSATDYLGAYAFLIALGFTSNAAHTALLPQAEIDRELNPSDSDDFPTAPTGGAATGLGNWAVEFRRPSVLRLYGHAWEWAGFLNYSKAIPAAQKDLSPQNKFTYYFTNDSGGRVVPQGSNEDGFNVTPRGLEDIETGATQSVESIGSSTLDEFQRTDFPNGLTASDITVDSLTINTSVSFPEVAAAKTNLLGPVTLASAEKLRSITAVTGATDAARDADINSTPEVVTLKGLNYWKNENKLVTARTGTQYVYVDPVNGRNISSIDALLVSPPVTQQGADTSADRAAASVKTLTAAVAYANQAYGPTTLVEYRIGPGVYLEKGAIAFNTLVNIRAWDFSSNTYLNNESDGGTEPFFGGEDETFSNYLDPTKQPVFLTYVAHSYLDNRISTGEGAALLQAQPLRLQFKYPAIIIGVVWWGITETATAGYRGAVAGRALIPDSFFDSSRITVSDWRDDAFADPDNSINYLNRVATKAAQTSTSTYRYYGHRPRPAIIFESSGGIRNCAFGAMSPANASILGDDSRFYSLISCGTEQVEMNGIRFCGNLRISSELNTGDYAGIVARNSTTGDYTVTSYVATGFNTYFIAPLSTKLYDPFCVAFGTVGGRITTVPSFGYNYPWVNFSLIYVDYNSATQTVNLGIATSTADPSGSGWKTLGPSFGSIFAPNYGVLIATANNWNRFRQSPATNTSGFDGKFGAHIYSQTSATTGTPVLTKGALVTGGATIYPLTAGTSNRETFFSVAGGDISVTGSATPDVASYVSGLSAGEVGAYITFTPLNIDLRGFKVGVDTTTATTVRNIDLVL